MKEIPKHTQKFIDFLENKVANVSSNQAGPLKWKLITTLFNQAEDLRDIKLILLKYIDDEHVKDKLITYMKDKYPDYVGIVEKLILLK